MVSQVPEPQWLLHDSQHRDGTGEQAVRQQLQHVVLVPVLHPPVIPQFGHQVAGPAVASRARPATQLSIKQATYRCFIVWSVTRPERILILLFFGKPILIRSFPDNLFPIIFLILIFIPKSILYIVNHAKGNAEHLKSF